MLFFFIDSANASTINLPNNLISIEDSAFENDMVIHTILYR